MQRSEDGGQRSGFDEGIRSRLAEFITENGFTHAQMAAKLRLTSPTRLTKYLNLHKEGAKPEQDAAKIETAAKNFLRHVSRRAQLKMSLFENPVSRQVAAYIEQIKRTIDVGLIYSIAGVGKTCGAELYCNDHPEALMMTAKNYQQGSRDVEGMLFELLQDGSYPGNMRRAVWMEEKLRGSDRVILIDNAHRLHVSAFNWIIDFHDATNVPVGLIGNPSVLGLVRNNDQVYTRIGLVRCVHVKGELAGTAEHMVRQFAPESKEALVEIVTDAIKSVRQLRTVKKQLLLAAELMRSKQFDDWVDAFGEAGTALVKPAFRGGVRVRDGEKEAA